MIEIVILKNFFHIPNKYVYVLFIIIFFNNRMVMIRSPNFHYLYKYFCGFLTIQIFVHKKGAGINSDLSPSETKTLYI